MKQRCLKITIVVRGRGDFDSSESAMFDALDAAVESVKDGCRTGSNCNDESGYYFNTDDNVPKKDWPA